MQPIDTQYLTTINATKLEVLKRTVSCAMASFIGNVSPCFNTLLKQEGTLERLCKTVSKSQTILSNTIITLPGCEHAPRNITTLGWKICLNFA